ncbi:MAG: bile acid:sodium symporter family protein [Pedobacter sp.]|nr:bile acid:sodium symporter family protein [Pedobacter sp.]
MINTLKPLLNDWFLRGMILAVIIASFFPDIGKSGGLLHLDLFINAGVAIVFFLHGMGIPTEQMKAGIRNWRLHIVVQAFTFVVFPLLFILFRFAFGHWLPPMLLLGFFYLCVLPSTITSSVAMTGMARGNVPAAIFNATISSLIGIVATPALVSLMSATTGETLSFGKAVLDIATLLLLPFVIGQLLHPVFGKWFAARKKYTSMADRGIVLLLVFSAFCDSVAAGLWTNYGPSLLVITLIGVSIILAVVLLLTRATARALNFNTEDEIVAVFCGSKKTLAAGVPMAKVLFGSHPGLGLIVLPIMFYHQIQLMVCSALAQRYAKRLEQR